MTRYWINDFADADRTSFTGLNFTTTPSALGNNWFIVDTDGTLNNAGAIAAEHRRIAART
jgi:hypothetical protein